jgi:multiple sugar transport system permease protein
VPQELINTLLVELAASDRAVVRLKGGDPFVFGRGGEEAEALADAGIPFEIVPGVTTPLGIAAYTGVPLTHREHTSAVTFVTGHAVDRIDWDKVGHAETLVIFMGLTTFPQIAIAGPVWRLLGALGWLNTYQGIVAAYIAFSLPFAIWVLTVFFKELPPEVEEAALIDGCTRWQALRLVVLPLAAPAIFTAALLVFVQAWNEFFFALIILTDPARQTLPVGIALFPGEYTMPWGEIAAASTVATLPLLVLTLAFQRRIVQGLSAGAIKG